MERKKIEELQKRHEEQMKLNPFQVVGDLKECYKCGRKILVERVLFGISHTSNIDVVCFECLNEEEKKKAELMYGKKNERSNIQKNKRE